MASGRDGGGDDYWSNEFDLGTLSTWQFSGPIGLERLSGPSRYFASDTAGFSARLRRVQLDHVAVEGFTATAHGADRTRTLIDRYSTPLLSAVRLVEGALRVEGEGDSFLLAAGEHMVVDSGAPLRYTAESGSRMLRVVVGVEHLPAHLRLGASSIARALPRTRLSDSLFLFVNGLLTSASQGRRPSGEHLIAAVADLQSAMLAEALQIVGHPEGPTGLRYRMEEYIEDRLGDPGLDPQQVADFVGISVRSAHTVFQEGDRTVSRFITDRRISAVARELRVQDAVEFATLHARYGFSSHDVMARSFRERFGMTPNQYRDGGHRNFG